MPTVLFPSTESPREWVLCGTNKDRGDHCSVLCVLRGLRRLLGGAPDFRLTRRFNPDKEITFNVQANLAPIGSDTKFLSPIFRIRDAIIAPTLTARVVRSPRRSCIKLFYSFDTLRASFVWKTLRGSRDHILHVDVFSLVELYGDEAVLVSFRRRNL